MYPTLVVVLVATRRSVLERSMDMASQLSSDVRFAANTGASTHGHNPLSQAFTYPHTDEDVIELGTISPETPFISSSDSGSIAERARQTRSREKKLGEEP